MYVDLAGWRTVRVGVLCKEGDDVVYGRRIKEDEWGEG
jgi:hypothetical protein